MRQAQLQSSGSNNRDLGESSRVICICAASIAAILVLSCTLAWITQTRLNARLLRSIPMSSSRDTLAVTRLVAEGAWVNARSQDGLSPLMLAVSGVDDPRTARYLLTMGADVNARDPGGWTPLMFAVSNGCLRCTRLLLDSGADVRAMTGEGLTAYGLGRTARSLNGKLVELLLERGAQPSATDRLWDAVQAGDTIQAESALRKGANIEATDAYDRTPLMEGVLQGRLTIVRLLLRWKGNPHHRSVQTEETAESIALELARSDLAQLIRQGTARRQVTNP